MYDIIYKYEKKLYSFVWRYMRNWGLILVVYLIMWKNWEGDYASI